MARRIASRVAVERNPPLVRCCALGMDAGWRRRMRLRVQHKSPTALSARERENSRGTGLTGTSNSKTTRPDPCGDLTTVVAGLFKGLDHGRTFRQRIVAGQIGA
jgi:hypothetical protein